MNILRELFTSSSSNLLNFTASYLRRSAILRRVPSKAIQASLARQNDIAACKLESIARGINVMFLVKQLECFAYFGLG